MTIALRDLFTGLGQDTRILASSAPYGSGKSQADYTCFGTVSRARVLNQVANPSAYRRLKSILSDFKPNIVHLRMFLGQLSPLILKLLEDFPTVYHATCYETICPTGFKTLPDQSACNDPVGRSCRRNGCLSFQAWPALMLQHELWRRWSHSIDRIVANSEFLASTLRTYGVEPVEVISNGVPIKPGRPPLRRRPIIAYAGRLHEGRGLHVLLRAFKQVRVVIPDAELVIAGAGEQRRQLEALSAELKIEPHVAWLGHLERDDLEREISKAWVQVLPSLVPETFGLAAAEAMMRGTAVVASDVGAIPEIVESGRTGLLAPPGDAASLASALCRVLQDRQWCDELGKAGRKRALSHLTDKECAGKFLDLYRSICIRRS